MVQCKPQIWGSEVQVNAPLQIAWLCSLGSAHLLDGEPLATTFASSFNTVSWPILPRPRPCLCSAPLCSRGRNCSNPTPCLFYHVQAQENCWKGAWDLTIPVADWRSWITLTHPEVYRSPLIRETQETERTRRINSAPSFPQWTILRCRGSTWPLSSCVFL